MDKEMFDTLLKAIVDMKDSMDKQFDTINERLEVIEEDIADIKSDIMIINAKIDKQSNQIKRIQKNI